MIVISDGAPVDDSTLSVNNPNILENHLKEVVTEIRRRIPEIVSLDESLDDVKTILFEEFEKYENIKRQYRAKK